MDVNKNKKGRGQVSRPVGAAAKGTASQGQSTRSATATLAMAEQGYASWAEVAWHVQCLQDKPDQTPLSSEKQQLSRSMVSVCT